MAKSHKQIVCLLQILSSNMENNRANKLISLKKAKTQPDLP